ncbi:MAG: OmpA family protein [Proteobacteria bacterium]|nr:MAG: OmpA family protein [Pseudomonadota bacterium]
MVRISRMKMLGLAVAGLSTVGCQNALHDDNLKLHAQNRELQGRVDALEGELGNRPDASQVTGMQGELAARDARIAELEQQLRTQPKGEAPTPGIEGIETEYDRAKGELTVRVPGDVLFDSGVATLKPSASATLDKIASSIKSQYGGKPVRVEGHTDSDPLVKTKSQWQDNRNLSLARALAVTRYLQGKGVDPKLIETSGFGEYHPRGNEKSKNRRVEIVVVTK